MNSGHANGRRITPAVAAAAILQIVQGEARTAPITPLLSPMPSIAVRAKLGVEDEFLRPGADAVFVAVAGLGCFVPKIAQGCRQRASQRAIVVRDENGGHGRSWVSAVSGCGSLRTNTALPDALPTLLKASSLRECISTRKSLRLPQSAADCWF
jgi:hypothetical protein